MKFRVFILFFALLSLREPLLLCQEQGANNPKEGTITVEQYCAFLNEVATAPGEVQEMEYATNPSRSPVEASNSSSFYNDAMDNLISRSGEPGNDHYEAISGQANMPMSLISWDDAERYCNWKNHSASTYNLNSSFVGAAHVDPSLKSNQLTFRLMSTGSSSYQAEGVDVAIGDSLLDNLLMDSLALVLADFGIERTGISSESRGEQHANIDVPILDNKIAERHGELLQGKAFFLENPRGEPENDFLIKIEQSSPEEHVRWDIREEADKLLSEIRGLEDDYQFSEIVGRHDPKNQKEATTIENKKKELVKVEALWQVMADSAEKNLNTLKRSKRPIQESREFWKKRDQEAIGLRKEYDASKQEETDRLNLLERINFLWNKKKDDHDYHVSYTYLRRHSDADSMDSSFDSQSQNSPQKTTVEYDDFLNLSKDWLEKARIANNVAEDQDPETHRKQWKETDEAAIQKRALFDEEKAEVKTKAIEERRWQAELARWNLRNKITALRIKKKELEDLHASLEEKSVNGGSPRTSASRIREALSNLSKVQTEIQTARDNWTQLAHDSGHLEIMLAARECSTTQEAQDILYNQDKAVNEAKKLLFKKLQRQSPFSTPPNLNTSNSSSHTSSPKSQSFFVQLEQRLKNDDHLMQATEDILNEYAQAALSEALYEIRKERPADLVLTSWQEKIARSEASIENAQFLAELSEKFIGIFKKEQPHLASIQEHLHQEIEKKTVEEAKHVSEITQDVLTTTMQALGLPASLAEGAARIATKHAQKTVAKLAEKLTKYIGENVSSTFDIEALVDSRKKLVEKSKLLLEAHKVAYREAAKEDKRLKEIEQKLEFFIQEAALKVKLEIEEAATDYVVGNRVAWLSLPEGQRAAYNKAVEAANASYYEQIEQERNDALKRVADAQKALEIFKSSSTQQIKNFLNGNKKLLKKEKELTAAQDNLDSVQKRLIQRETFLNWERLTPTKRATQLAHKSKQKANETTSPPDLISCFEEQSRNWDNVALYWDKAQASNNEEVSLYWKQLANQFQLAAEHQQKLIDAINNQYEIQKLHTEYNSLKSDIEKNKKIATCFEQAAIATSKDLSALWINAAEALKLNDTDLAELYIKAAEATLQNNGLAIFYLKAAAAKKTNKTDLYNLWLKTTSTEGKLKQLWNNAATALEEKKEETSSYFVHAAQATANHQEKLSSLWEKAALETKERPRQLWQKAALALQDQNEKLSQLWESSVESLNNKKNNLSSIFENAASALQAQNKRLSTLWESAAKAFCESNYDSNNHTFLLWKDAAEAFSNRQSERSDLLAQAAQANNAELSLLWNEAAIALQRGNRPLSALFKNAAKADTDQLRQLWREAANALKDNKPNLAALFKNAAETNDDSVRLLWNEAIIALQQRNQPLSTLFENAAKADKDEPRQLWCEAASALKDNKPDLATLFENAAKADDITLRQFWHEAASAFYVGNYPLSTLFENVATADNDELRQLWHEAAMALKNDNPLLSELFTRSAEAKIKHQVELSLSLDRAAYHLKEGKNELSGYFLKAAKAHELDRIKLADLWEQVADAHSEDKPNSKRLWKKAAQAMEKNKQALSQFWIKSANALLNNDPNLSQFWENIAQAKERNHNSFELWMKAAQALEDGKEHLFNYWKNAATEIEHNNSNRSHFWKEAAIASELLDVYKIEANKTYDFYTHDYLKKIIADMERAISNLVKLLDSNNDSQEAHEALEEIKRIQNSKEDKPSSCTIS